ncbi:hypothetical protein B0J13DRAFT_626715 [Dactylonectria estremocensis]|uniref:Uncharacterized protein n=1 Tax=Dactylonectria estremocensis TaxID=1079267 RepID=A0A9P9E6Q6_9HYPO|nr:hypothetical protein B0J13DRAFT_626715 [Dactylonectria estremocensis]
MSSCAAFYALTYALTPEEEPHIYYSGPFYDILHSQDFPAGGNALPLPMTAEQPATATRGLTSFQLVNSLVIDSLTIVSTGLNINNAVCLPTSSPASGIAFSTWVYPTLPVALLGLWLLICGS